LYKSILKIYDKKFENPYKIEHRKHRQ